MTARARGRAYAAVMVLAIAGMAFASAGCDEKTKLAGLATVATFASLRTDAIQDLADVDTNMSQKMDTDVKAATQARDMVLLAELERNYAAYRVRRDKARAALKAMGPILQSIADEIRAGRVDIPRLVRLGAEATELLGAVGVKVRFDVGAIAGGGG